MEVTRQRLETLRKEADALAEKVAEGTRDSKDPRVRTEGARFSEVLGEWLDQIDELFECGDPDLPEICANFVVRLRLAEQKVEGWGLPTVAPRSPGRKGSGVRRAA